MTRFYRLCGALLPLLAGCSSNDADHLARIGRKTVNKTASLAGGEGGWQMFRAGLDEATLDARVSARLRWDKVLADTSIEVRTNGPVVELRGRVRDLAQRRKAVELAESTAGVERVVDALEQPK